MNRPPAPRSTAIDTLRGVVMALMTLDHTRDFFSDAAYDPMDLSRTTPGLFLTRWVTHFCAPVFVFLAGTGAFFYGAGGRTKVQLALYLVSRGLWLVVLEFTLVHLGWFFNWHYDIVIAQVIWAIGWSMVALAGLAFLPPWAVASLGLAFVAGHNALDALTPPGRFAPDWMVLAQLRPGLVRLGAEAPVVFQGYPVLPWLGIMALGYGFGAIWREAPRRRSTTTLLGALAVVLFVALRWSGLYGNPQPWQTQIDGVRTALAFLDCSKYPPSLLYVLMTLGPALLALAALDRAPGAAGGMFMAFGRVPLFFYLLHVPLIHLAAMGVSWFRDGEAAFLLTHPVLGRENFPAGYGYGLPVVYLATACILLVLYPLCRWYGGLKRRHPSVWLSIL